MYVSWVLSLTALLNCVTHLRYKADNYDGCAIQRLSLRFFANVNWQENLIHLLCLKIGLTNVSLKSGNRMSVSCADRALNGFSHCHCNILAFLNHDCLENKYQLSSRAMLFLFMYGSTDSLLFLFRSVNKLYWIWRFPFICQEVYFLVLTVVL